MKPTISAILAITLTLALAMARFSVAQQTPAATEKTSTTAESAKPTGILHTAELEKLLPPSVYFQGQSATVQVRNSGGVRFPGGAVMMAVKVDTGGYSTAVKERYQAYLITEAPLQLGEGEASKILNPGAYGIGFVAEGLLVMDIGGHTLLTLQTPTDPSLRRPSPLQVVAHESSFRLYSGRSYINFAAAL